MGRGHWRRHARGALGALVVVGLAIVGARLDLTEADALPPSLRPAAEAPRVLFLGDSIMDQQGNHAAFLLRQSGVDARVEARWGSTLFTAGQYDRGESRFTKPVNDRSTHWLSLAPQVLARHHPTLVVASLNHNYWIPVPTDARGEPIVDLRGPSARLMIDQQVRAFVQIVRGAGAELVWVAPTASATRVRDLWPSIKASLSRAGVDIIEPNLALSGNGGRRMTTKRDCAGKERALWFDDDIHLTRFGAGRSATGLARSIARHLSVSLLDASAPGEPAVAIVPVARGYYVVQCDGSVFRFGGAPAVGSARSRVVGGAAVVDARAGSDGGLWLVRADASVIGVETAGAPPVVDRRSLEESLSALTVFRDARVGFRVVTRLGDVREFAGAPDLGDAREVVSRDPIRRAFALAHPRPAVVDAAATAAGFLVVTENGEVIARGDAVLAGDTAHLALYTD